MESNKNEQGPSIYAIHIKNNIDTGWEAWFEGMKINHTEDGETVLTGEVLDQSALYGLLEKIHSLNLKLISFQRTDPG